MHSEPPQKTPTISSRDGRKLILSVDDDKRVLLARYRLLEDAGYAVLSAADGAEALQLFGTNPIDLVLLDYSMPGVPANVVALAMKDYKPSVPVIFVSGIEVPEHALREVNHFIRKAEGPELLLRAIQELLASRSTASRDDREQAS
ncbi:MAG: response regulator [Candidatus Sulfotelmatobacter sp.]